MPPVTRKSRGFSLVELLVAMTLGLIVLAGAVALFRQGVDVSYMVTQRAEMQQNARVAINTIARDLSIAGTGVPAGGIQLPSGAGSTGSLRGCSVAACGLWGYLVDNRLYSVTPGDGVGPVVSGVATDIVTVVYADYRLDLNNCPATNITPAGSQMDLDKALCPDVTSPAVGLVIGDMIVLCNINGCAAGVVTNVQSSGPTLKVIYANSDPLSVNQPSAAFGNIAALANPPPPPGNYPQTRAFRILTTTYFIDIPAGPDGVVGTGDDGSPRLMRQVNALAPAPVAENIENLQFSYDIFDENLGVATANLPDAAGAPNQIRKINISVRARSPVQGLFRRGYERLALTTSVSGRNLTFKDRYE